MADAAVRRLVRMGAPGRLTSRAGYSPTMSHSGASGGDRGARGGSPSLPRCHPVATAGRSSCALECRRVPTSDRLDRPNPRKCAPRLGFGSDVPSSTGEACASSPASLLALRLLVNDGASVCRCGEQLADRLVGIPRSIQIARLESGAHRPRELFHHDRPGRGRNGGSAWLP